MLGHAMLERDIDPFIPQFLLDRIAAQYVSSRADIVALSTVNKSCSINSRPRLWSRVSFSPAKPPSSFVALSTYTDLCEHIFEIKVSTLLPEGEYDHLLHVLDRVRNEHAHFLVVLYLCDMDLTEIPTAVLMEMVTGVGEVHLFNCSCSSVAVSNLISSAREMHNLVLHAAKFDASVQHESVLPSSLTKCTFLPCTPADEAMALKWIPYVLFCAPIRHLTIAVYSVDALQCVSRFESTLRYLSIKVVINGRDSAPFISIPLTGFHFLTTVKVDCVPCDFLYPERNIVAWAVKAPCLSVLYIRAYAEYFEAECWDMLPSILGEAPCLRLVSVCFLIRRTSCFKPASVDVEEAGKRVYNALHSDTNLYALKTRAVLAKPADIIG